MKRAVLRGALTAAVLGVTWSAAANDADVKAGEQLYTKECLVCHGQIGTAQRGTDTRMASKQPLRLARAGAVMSDISAGVYDHAVPMQLAVVPPFGPNLTGIIGRPAGTYEGFHYSANFLKALKGTAWTEELLDAWITDSQKRVQGVTMFYRQKDPDIRKKIIAYLKANSK